MSRKFLLLLPVLAAAVLLLVGLSRGPGEPGAPRPPEPARFLPAPADPGALPAEAGAEGVAPGPEGDVPATGTGGLPLTVRVVDGLTGGTVPGADVTLFQSWDRRWPLERRGDLHLLPESPFRPGDRVEGRLRIAPPEGRVAFPARGTELDAPVHREARELSAVVVVWPEAPVTLVAVDENDVPLEGVTCEEARLGETLLPMAGKETGPDGAVRLAGIPLVPGESLTVRADFLFEVPGRKPIIGTVQSDPVLLDPSRAPFTAVVRFTRDFVDESRFDEVTGIGLGGGSGGRMPPEPPRDAKLAVTVLRADGGPAAGVLVVVRDHRSTAKVRTDEEGRAFFDALLPGHATVTVREPGFLCSEEQGVALEPGATPRVTLREETGRPFCVVVRDALGRPCPGAYVELGSYGGVPLVFLENGVQPLDFVTDDHGEVRFENFPAGKVRIEVRIGTREYDVTAGADGILTLTLAPPREEPR